MSSEQLGTFAFWSIVVLVPKPGKGHVASGRLQGIDYSLHDAGKDWIVELPLEGFDCSGLVYRMFEYGTIKVTITGSVTVSG